MADAKQFDADQHAFWNGHGGRTWVARQQHTDITLAPVSEALLACAAPHAGERVLDVGCGAARQPRLRARRRTTGRVAALDISARCFRGRTRAARAAYQCRLGAGRRRVSSADEFELLVSHFGVMFFGDPVAGSPTCARREPRGAMAFVCWRDYRKPVDGDTAASGLSSCARTPEAQSDFPGMFAFAIHGASPTYSPRPVGQHHASVTQRRHRHRRRPRARGGG